MADASREDFIDDAVAPLGDNPELQLLARGELEQRIDPAAAGLPELDRRRPPMLAWILATAILSILALHGPVRDVLVLRSIYEGTIMFGIPQFDHDELRQRLARNRPADEALLLVGDWTRNQDHERWSALWQRHPDDPAILARYLAACADREPARVDELLEVAAQVEPDNGWFAFLAAAGRSDEVVEKVSLNHADRKAGKLPGWTIHDPQRLGESLQLASRAAAAGSFRDTSRELSIRQYSLIAPVTDLRSHLIHAGFTLQDGSSGSLAAIKLSKAFTAAAWESGRDRDADRLRRLIADHARLSERLNDSSACLLDLLIARVFALDPLEQFVAAARSAGLSEAEVAGLEARERRMREYREAIRQAEVPAEEAEWLDERAGAISGSSAATARRQVLRPPPVDVAELAPGRRLEHAVVGRLASFGLWLVLVLLTAGAALVMRLTGKVERRLARSMARGFRWTDSLWVLSLGIAIPLAGFLAVHYLTPLGGLDWSTKHTLVPMRALQWPALALLLLMAPLLAARWRVRRRFAALASGGLGPPLAALAPAALVIPLAGWATPAFDHPELISWIGGSMLGIAVLGLAGAALLARVRKQPPALDLCLAWQLGGSALCGSMIASLALGFAFHLEERAWIARDPFLRPDPGDPGTYRWESVITAIGRDEFDEVWNPSE